MPRIAKPAFDTAHPLYQKDVHKTPCGAVTINGIHWTEFTEVDGVIDKLDELEREIKSVLYSRSPISITIEIGGPLELPEKDRYQRLFDYFAPKVWQLTVLIAQLNKKPLPGSTVELSPHLSLFRKEFSRLDGATIHDDPLDYKQAIEQAIFSYLKYLPHPDFQQPRIRHAQRIARQHKRTTEAFSRPGFSNTATEFSVLLFGYREESRSFSDVLADKETLLETARMSHSTYQRKVGDIGDFKFFARLCYAPVLGHYWILSIPTPHSEYRQILEGDLAMKWVLGTDQSTFCARPRVTDYTLVGVLEYLELQIDKEGLVHTTFDTDINRIYHTN